MSNQVNDDLLERAGAAMHETTQIISILIDSNDLEGLLTYLAKLNKLNEDFAGVNR